MKFGYRLSQETFMPWRSNYLLYDRIKALIRQAPQDWEEIDQWLQAEFTKIHTFLSQKTNTLHSQLELLELDTARSLDDLINPLYELHELVRYLNLSVTGFEKLLKSLDKRSPCKSTLGSLPITLDRCYPSLHELLVRVAHIKQKRLQHKESVFSFQSRTTRPLPPLPDNDQRSTLYFWIHPDHAFELKAMLLFYCNLIDHYTISSTFLDNREWQVYYSLLNEPSAESMELCWRPSSTLSTVQVNHRIKNDNGVDHVRRHAIPHSTVDSLFRPLPPINDDHPRTALVVEPKTKNSSSGLMVGPKKKNHNAQMVDLTTRRIQQRDWKPVVSCTRQRSTFSTDGKIEIHLDTNFDQQGRRTGLTMMVVTQCTAWLKGIVENNDWIQPVPRFSYHSHFVSQYFNDQVAYLPWWKESFDRTWLEAETTTSGLTWSADYEQPLLDKAPPPWQSHLVVQIQNIKPPKKKKRWTRVEPKVFFANERTFLSWLQFCALLLTVSLNMINFGGPADALSRGCGATFMILTILLALYALTKYEFRAWHLLTGSTQYRFDDTYGPAILCVLLIVAMLINIGLRLN